MSERTLTALERAQRAADPHGFLRSPYPLARGLVAVWMGDPPVQVAGPPSIKAIAAAYDEDLETHRRRNEI